MYRFMDLRRRVGWGLGGIFLFTVAALLSSCNSAGGGTAPPAAAVAITAQNSAQASGAAYQGASTASSSGSSGTAVLTGTVTVGGGGSPDLARFARSQLALLASLGYTSGTPLLVGGVISRSASCDPPLAGVPGSVAVSFDDADNNGRLSSGDTLNASFSNCYLASEGKTFSGAFSLTGLTLTGTPSVAGTVWSATATFSFSNLQISGLAAGDTVQGAFTYSGGSQDGVTISGSLSGASLSIQRSPGPTLTLSNFSLSATEDASTGAYSFYGSGRVTDSALGGYVDFQIPSSTPFAGVGSADPSSGSMTVTGANGTRVRLTALGASAVRLDVDTNGDGAYDLTLSESWSDIAQ